MKTKGWRGSREAWLNIAKDILIDQGESSVTVQAMAKRLKLSRTSFYWFFQDRQDVMQALLDLWAHTNTKPIQDASNAYAETMVEAVLNVTYTLISEAEYGNGAEDGSNKQSIANGLSSSFRITSWCVFGGMPDWCTCDGPKSNWCHENFSAGRYPTASSLKSYLRPPTTSHVTL